MIKTNLLPHPFCGMMKRDVETLYEIAKRVYKFKLLECGGDSMKVINGTDFQTNGITYIRSGTMIEFDVDMGYLLEEGELDCVMLNDENGEHEPMRFVREHMCTVDATLGNKRIKQLEELIRAMYLDLLAEMPESLLENRLIQMDELGIEVYRDDN